MYTLQDKKLMQAAIDCGKQCSSVESAYNVGAVIADANGAIISTGYSRQLPGNTHAEQCALLNLPDSQQLADASLYTTMEPCSKRLSGNVPCVSLILQSGIKRVFVGVREPPNFVNCTGAEELQAEGVEVIYISELEDECRELNRHLTG
ncbi:CMP/dCMP deaminase zinc-binding protein [Coemansia mojavensis]|nr:CMP/dCMP deaminase zinc-binding protein [Coemansia mojavensis]